MIFRSLPNIFDRAFCKKKGNYMNWAKRFMLTQKFTKHSEIFNKKYL